MKQRLAIFKDMQFGGEHASLDCMEGSASYVRISDYVEVDFPELSGDDQIAGQVRKLDEMRDREVEQHARKLADIADRKSKLLAITHQPENKQ